MVACVGGGSNAIGVMNAFLDDERVNLYGYEAGGNGPESGKHAIRFAPGTGQLGMFQGAKSYLLETDEGDTRKIRAATDALNAASGDFAARRMDASIKRALAGRSLETL